MRGVCRDYCKETLTEALNLARVHVASKWRQVGSVSYPPDIREVLVAFPSPFILTLEPSE